MSTLTLTRASAADATTNGVAKVVQQTGMTVRIARRIEETADVVLLELASIDGEELPPFAAGSHIDVEIGPGLTRQYSLCNNPGERHRYLIGVLRETASRGGSAAMHGVAVGDRLRISQPRNHFALVTGAHDSLLMAGGIGITPILCMAERLANIDAPFTMHYAARSADRMAFRQRIADAHFGDKVQLHLDDGPVEQRLDMAAAIAGMAPDGHLYVCGPPGFIAAALAAADVQGLPPAQVHREHFTPPDPLSTEPAGEFQVKIASSGTVIDVGANQTVVEALAEHGIEIETSCAQGVCGTCITRVLEGTPDHRDYFLSEEEQQANSEFLPCCSRSLSPMLVLDL